MLARPLLARYAHHRFATAWRKPWRRSLFGGRESARRDTPTIKWAIERSIEKVNPSCRRTSFRRKTCRLERMR